MSLESRDKANSLPELESNGYFSCKGMKEKEKERKETVVLCQLLPTGLDQTWDMASLIHLLLDPASGAR